MTSLFLVVNSACDIACNYCFYTTGYEKRSRDRILPRQAGHVAKRIAEARFGTVILTGGDPLHSVHKRETYELVSALKANALRVVINTSAAHLAERDFDRLVELTVDRVDVSIDSHDPAVHDAQRGRHTDAVTAIRGLIQRGMPLSTTTVATARNAPTLSRTIEWLRDLGVSDIRVQKAFLPGGDLVGHRIVDASLRAVAPLLGRPHAARYLEQTISLFRGKGPLPEARCPMGKEYFVCDARGNLSPCFHRGDISLGNLFEDELSTLLGAMESNPLGSEALPLCVGSHCASLFDNPSLWRNQDEKVPSRSLPAV